MSEKYGLLSVCSLSNSNYFTSAKKCRNKSCIIDFMSTKMEIALVSFKKLHFPKKVLQINYFISKTCLTIQIDFNEVMITGRLNIT